MTQGGNENKYSGSQVGGSRAPRELTETHRAGVEIAREEGELRGEQTGQGRL